MKNKNPWLPLKPVRALKCKTCRGTGVASYYSLFDGVRDQTCRDCGGKGFR